MLEVTHVWERLSEFAKYLESQLGQRQGKAVSTQASTETAEATSTHSDSETIRKCYPLVNQGEDDAICSVCGSQYKNETEKLLDRM